MSALILSPLILSPRVASAQSAPTRSQRASGPSAPREQLERIAVLQLNNRVQMSREEVDYLTGLVRRVISKRLSRDYLIMTRENIEVLLPPDADLAECVSECQVETGRTIGARYIITGEVLKFGSSLRLTLRMHDTQSGRLIASEVAKATDLEGLEEPAERAVDQLAAQIDSRSARAEPDSAGRTPTGSASGDPRPLERPEPGSARPLTRRERLLAEARARIERERTRELKLEQEREFERERERARERARREEQQRERAQQERARERAREREREREKRSSLGSDQSPEGRLRERAQEAEESRKRHFGETSRAKPAQPKSTQKQMKRPSSESLNNSGFGLSLGFGNAQCQNVNSESGQLLIDCDQLNQGLAFDFAFNYPLVRSHRDSFFGWSLNVDVRYLHTNISGLDLQDGFLDSYTVNTFTLGLLGSLNMGALYARVLAGAGGSSGAIGITGEAFELEFNDVVTLVLGFELGWRLTRNLMISVYQQGSTLLDEHELCNSFGTCSYDMVELSPSIQRGLRFSLIF